MSGVSQQVEEIVRRAEAAEQAGNTAAAVKEVIRAVKLLNQQTSGVQHDPSRLPR